MNRTNNLGLKLYENYNGQFDCCNIYGTTLIPISTSPDLADAFCFRDSDGYYGVYGRNEIYKIPLCYIEEKAVYKDDILYLKG